MGYRRLMLIPVQKSRLSHPTCRPQRPWVLLVLLLELREVTLILVPKSRLKYPTYRPERPWVLIHREVKKPNQLRQAFQP